MINEHIEKETISVFKHTWQIIANPTAMANSGCKYWDKIIRQLRQLQLDYRFVISNDKDASQAIIKELKAQLEKDSNSSNIKDTIWLLYDTSLLNSGFSIEDPNAFAKRTYKMILFGLQDDSIPATEPKKEEEKKEEGGEKKEEDKKESQPNSFLESID